MQNKLITLGVIIVLFAGIFLYVFKQSLDDYVYENSLASVTVTPPTGWQVADYEPTDGLAITGPTTNVIAAAQPATDEILQKLQPEGDMDSISHTFTKGAEMVILNIQTAPYLRPISELSQQLGAATLNTSWRDQKYTFGTLSGIPIIADPMSVETADGPDAPVNYRHMTATVGDETEDHVVKLTVLTNSSDAAVAAVLSGIDMENIHERIGAPDARFAADAGFVPDAALITPLSDTAPAASVGFNAFTLLASDAEFTEQEREILGAIGAGAITDLAGLQEQFPDATDINPKALEVLQ